MKIQVSRTQLEQIMNKNNKLIKKLIDKCSNYEKKIEQLSKQLEHERKK